MTLYHSAVIPMCATHGLARMCHVCIGYCSEILINKMTLPKRGLLGGRMLLQAQLLHIATSLMLNYGFIAIFLNPSLLL